MYSFPPPFGCLCALRTSLAREYFSTLKWKVGPRGVRARRRFVFPEPDLEKRSRCDTPKGPHIVT
jgi:hypothetical protein